MTTTLAPEFKPNLSLFFIGLKERLNKTITPDKEAPGYQLKEILEEEKFKTSMIGYLIAFLCLLTLIPWLAMVIHSLQLENSYFFLFIGALGFLTFFYILFKIFKSAISSKAYYIETCKIGYNLKYNQQLIVLK